jgi:hypothetical protein
MKKIMVLLLSLTSTPQAWGCNLSDASRYEHGKRVLASLGGSKSTTASSSTAPKSTRK